MNVLSRTVFAFVVGVIIVASPLARLRGGTPHDGLVPSAKIGNGLADCDTRVFRVWGTLHERRQEPRIVVEPESALALMDDKKSPTTI